MVKEQRKPKHYDIGRVTATMERALPSPWWPFDNDKGRRMFAAAKFKAFTVSPPTGDWVIHAICAHKNGRASGIDLIAAVMLKVDVTTAASALMPLRNASGTRKNHRTTGTKALSLCQKGRPQSPVNATTEQTSLCFRSLPRCFAKSFWTGFQGPIDPLIRREQPGFRCNRSRRYTGIL